MTAASTAVREGGPLSANDRRARRYNLNVQFKNHLDVLRLGTESIAWDGFAAMLSEDRAFLVSDLHGYSLKGWNASTPLRCVVRASARTRLVNTHATSTDSVSRPTRVPFAVYPLHPVACARIIGDLAILHVETSATALERSVRAEGIDAQRVRPVGAPLAGSRRSPDEHGYQDKQSRA